MMREHPKLCNFSIVNQYGTQNYNSCRFQNNECVKGPRVYGRMVNAQNPEWPCTSYPVTTKNHCQHIPLVSEFSSDPTTYDCKHVHSGLTGYRCCNPLNPTDGNCVPDDLNPDARNKCRDGLPASPEDASKYICYFAKDDNVKISDNPTVATVRTSDGHFQSGSPAEICPMIHDLQTCLRNQHGDNPICTWDPGDQVQNARCITAQK